MANPKMNAPGINACELVNSDATRRLRIVIEGNMGRECRAGDTGGENYIIVSKISLLRQHAISFSWQAVSAMALSRPSASHGENNGMTLDIADIKT